MLVWNPQGSSASFSYFDPVSVKGERSENRILTVLGQERNQCRAQDEEELSIETKGRIKVVKVITIAEIPGILPPDHFDMLSYRIVDANIGAKGMGASLGRMEPNGRTGPHAHENAEQLFIILKGEMLMKTDRGEARLKAGQAAFIYPGEAHENYNVANGMTEYLVVTSKLST